MSSPVRRVCRPAFSRRVFALCVLGRGPRGNGAARAGNSARSASVHQDFTASNPAVRRKTSTAFTVRLSRTIAGRSRAGLLCVLNLLTSPGIPSRAMASHDLSPRPGPSSQLPGVFQNFVATALGAGCLPAVVYSWEAYFGTAAPEWIKGVGPNVIGAVVLIPLFWLISRSARLVWSQRDCREIGGAGP